HSIGLATEHTEKAIRDNVNKIIEAINSIGEPTDIKTIADKVNSTDVKHTEALASISKNIATLNGRWGLVKWPMVNPKNIRDKIYVILHESGKQMHFNQIAEAIKQSDFKRKDVTTQAIHNELIKDKRFVLIGRGIYALKEWGYEKETVDNIIDEVIQKEDAHLTRCEIIQSNLKRRYLSETTIHQH